MIVAAAGCSAMNRKQHIEKQFEDLQTEGTRIQSTQSDIPSLRSSQESIEQYKVSKEAFGIQAAQLIERVCGSRSPHSHRIEELERERTRNQSFTLAHHVGVLQAAKADFINGMFDNIRMLVRADLLGDFLSQAEELHLSGFHEASVSLSGAILEDTLRKLSDKHSVAYGVKTTIDSLNVELARAQVYDRLVQKRITHLAHLRNDADHGRSLGTVKPEDAKDMLDWLRRFVTDHLN